MEQEHARSRSVTGDPRAPTAVVGQTGAQFVRSIADENRQITEVLKFLDEALAFRAIDELMSVESVVHVLRDEDEILKFMGSFPPESGMHKNYFAAIKIVSCLLYWQKEGLVSRHDSMPNAIVALMGKALENEEVLKNLA